MIKFILGYREALFNKSLIESFATSFKTLVSKIVNNELINCKTYCVLDTETYNQIVYQFNNTEKSYPQNKTIHQLFEEQVAKTPNNIAVVYEDTELTYKDLNERVNQLANYLKSTYHIKGDDLVALCLDRSEYILIAILGVLKAGGAYVPMDPAYPDDRISFILNDTKAKVLITTSQCEQRVAIFNYSSVEGSLDSSLPHSCVREDDKMDILIIDNDEFSQILKKCPKTNPTLNINSSNLAYVIYTSGTTGKPKGVMIEHSSVIKYNVYAIIDKFSYHVRENCAVIFTSRVCI